METMMQNETGLEGKPVENPAGKPAENWAENPTGKPAENQADHPQKPLTRCEWAGPDQIYIDYHDKEWGVPLHDDTRLFEMLILEGMQAGLSWITILKKREAFREAFDHFDPEKVALYGEDKVETLMENKGIIRNRRKIEAAVVNAKLFLEIQKEYGSFDRFIWKYVDGTPVMGNARTLAEVPVTTPLSDQISKDLKKRGFKFVGSTIIYSFMQAVGMVNDHVVGCMCRMPQQDKK